jgi:hypothetical protein
MPFASLTPALSQRGRGDCFGKVITLSTDSNLPPEGPEGEDLPPEQPVTEPVGGGDGSPPAARLLEMPIEEELK